MSALRSSSHEMQVLLCRHRGGGAGHLQGGSEHPCAGGTLAQRKGRGGRTRQRRGLGHLEGRGEGGRTGQNSSRGGGGIIERATAREGERTLPSSSRHGVGHRREHRG